VPGARAEGASRSEEEDATDVSQEDAQLFVVRLLRDECTVSADASGALLHRRGYRQATAKAPLRETIAAALIAASGWDGVAPLVDPLCGSGTIPIEAALRAMGIPPGKNRPFAAERWPGVSHTVVERARTELAEAAARTRSVPLPAIVGSDRDEGAVAAARANAERAGVATETTFAVHALSDAAFPTGQRGWIVSNPPYGVRVGDAGRVRDLWAQLGHVLRARAAGWRIALLSPEPALERQLRMPLRVVAQTSNGGIPIRLVVGEVEG
jgi:putative N6-adenine-specific DNA methylase